MTVSMGTPSTIKAGTSPSGNDFLDAEDGSVAGSAAAAVSHSHAITAYSDTTSNFGHVLKSSATGGLVIKDLNITDSLVVDGSEIVLGSDNLTIEDNELQINWSQANGGGYTTDNSAIIMGHDDISKGTKLISEDTVMKITDIPSGEAAGGSLTPGTARDIICGDVQCQEISAQSFTGTGGATIGGAVISGSFIAMAAMNTAPAGPTAGTMYFDGSDFWIDL